MAGLQRLMNLFRRGRMQQEIDAEIEAHVAMRIDENVARGMTPEEARRDALLRFGNRTATREHVAASDSLLGLAAVGRDVRYAVRQLRRSPGFAMTAILTLAFGIGANVVVFGVLNAMLLRPLPVADAGRLYEVLNREAGADNQSYPDYLDFKARNASFSEMAAYRLGSAGMSAGGEVETSWDYEVSGNYFDLLGVQPQVGRLFHASDEHGANSAPYVVLSDGLWRRRFNADPRVVGTTVELNKKPFTIVGVAPKSFHGTEIFFWPEFWMPMVNEQQVEGYNYLTKRQNHGIFVIGMLKPGVTPEQATENLRAVGRELGKEYPQTDDGLTPRLVKPGLLGDELGGPAWPFLLALLGLAAACVNLAGIFAARAADRTRELAIRLSIGSTRGRILRQLLTEALVISLAGGVLGTGFAAVLLTGLSRWQPIAAYPIHVTVDPDWLVFAVALGLAVVSGMLPGLLPARQVWRTDAMQAMKSGAAAGTALKRLNLRDLLLGVQITLCAVLVTASLVAVRGMERMLHAPLGFEPHGALLAEANLQMAGYSDDSALAVQRRMIDEAARVPGVTAVGLVNDQPLSGSGSNTGVYRDGTKDLRPTETLTTVHYYSISPGYFRAAQTRLLAGRDVRWEDDGPTTPQVAVINQHLARLLFGDQQAVGKHFMTGGGSRYEVAGVVEDGKYDMLTEEPSGAIFFPLGQSHDASTTLVVRSALPAAETANALHRMMTSVDASMPIVLENWTSALALVQFPARIATAALGVMGLLAAMLAVTGVFGMAAYTVSKRLRELGLRVALGARRAQVVRAALMRPLMVLTAGSAVGLGLGVVGSRMLANVVYEATPRDPLVLLGAVAAMTAIGLAATWIPARRALRVNPAALLREE